MVEVIREYIVKEGARGQFELAFGPGGAWGRLVEDRPGFRGTTLLRDTDDGRRYLTIELWEAADHRARMLTECADQVVALEAAFTDWTESRAELGTYRVLAEATVRPRGRGGRRKPGSPVRMDRR
jgi:hypothetical protein